ncbi:hypothetical protein [Salinigranum sp. GCM10025319]|uniref:hypothetical protein n=1 Tax=Salinigranum sp. GCM10025319 TaxID=3252687 RepID=UPI00360F67A2
METDRIADVVLGTVMIVLGLVPTALLVLDRGRPVLLDSAGVLPTQLRTLLLVVTGLCGLVLAAMGIVTIRYGRSRSRSTGLY